MNLSRLLLILFLLALVLGGRRLFQSLANPISIAVGPWLVILAGQQILAPDFVFAAPAAVVIGGALSALALGCVAAVYRSPYRFSRASITIEPCSGASMRLIHRATSWLFVSAAATNLVIVYHYGYNLGAGLAESGKLAHYSLFEAVQAGPLGWLQRACTSLTYLGAAFLGLEIALRRRLTVSGLSLLVVVLFEAVMISHRLPMFITSSFILAAWIIVAAPKLRTLPVRVAGGACLALAAAIFFFGYTAINRPGAENRQILDNVLVSLFGSPSVFSLYLENTDAWQTGQFSGSSIKGVLALLGASDRGWWSYREVFISDERAENTNIVTGLAQFCDDAGVWGVLILMSALGWISGSLSIRSLHRASPTTVSGLTTIYVLLMWLPITAMTYYVYWWGCLVALPILAAMFLRERPNLAVFHSPERPQRSLQCTFGS